MISRIEVDQESQTYLRERAVVPDVTVMREAVPHKAETTTLDILLDRIEGLLFGDLHLSVGPSGDFDDHIEDTGVLVGEERDIVEARHDAAILLDENAVLCRSDQIGR